MPQDIVLRNKNIYLYNHIHLSTLTHLNFVESLFCIPNLLVDLIMSYLASFFLQYRTHSRILYDISHHISLTSFDLEDFLSFSLPFNDIDIFEEQAHILKNWMLLIFFNFIYLFWGRKSREGQREGERESQAGSALSGQIPTWGSISQTVRSCPEPKSRVGWLIGWATQVPHRRLLIFYLSTMSSWLDWSYEYVAFPEILHRRSYSPSQSIMSTCLLLVLLTLITPSGCFLVSPLLWVLLFSLQVTAICGTDFQVHTNALLLIKFPVLI